VISDFSRKPAGMGQRAVRRVGAKPVGGATGVQYTRRSADGKAQRRERASIWDREVDLGPVLSFQLVGIPQSQLAIVFRCPKRQAGGLSHE